MFLHYNEDGHSMALFEESYGRDEFEVLFLADLVQEIGSECAFGIVTAGNQSTVTLALDALEGLPWNAFFCYDVEIDLSMFLQPESTILTGAVHLIRFPQKEKVV